MTCETVDELASAYALGAVSPEEDRAISAHLATCDRPHAEARSLLGAAALVPAGLEAVTPPPGLRDRVMASVAATRQDHVPPAREPAPLLVEAATPRAPWWRLVPLPSALAAVGLAAAVGLGAWGVTLNQQLAERDAALRAVAGADAAYAVSGSAGSGWVLETDGRAIFLADSLAALPADQLYEFWLIDADGTAVAAGTLTDTDGVALVTLERSLGDATTFAVTVETERVEQSVNQPVMVAAIDA